MGSLRRWVRTKHAQHRELMASLAEESFAYQMGHPNDGLSGGSLDKIRQDLLLKGRGWDHEPDAARPVAAVERPIVQRVSVKKGLRPGALDAPSS